MTIEHITRGELMAEPDEQETPDMLSQKRQASISYIKSQLLPELAAIYSDAIASSVETGCYDANFGQGDYSRVEAYIEVLKRDWLSKQGDTTPLIARIQYLRAFGTDKQKDMLAKLELI